MTFAYDFTEDDLLSWYRYYYASSPFPRRKRNRYIAAWAGIFFGFAIVAVCYFQSLPSTIIAIALAVMLSVLTRYVYDDQIDHHLKNYSSQSNDNFGPHQLILSNYGLQEITPATDTRIKWQSVGDVIAQDNHIFIRLTTGYAAVISDKSYSGPVAFAELPQILIDFKKKYAV